VQWGQGQGPRTSGDDELIAAGFFHAEDFRPFGDGDSLEEQAAILLEFQGGPDPQVFGRDTMDEVETAVDHVGRRIHFEA
jgi:hypothetical protein